MTSEGLVEMFKGDSADMCAEKFPLVLMGAERRQRVKRAHSIYSYRDSDILSL